MGVSLLLSTTIVRRYHKLIAVLLSIRDTNVRGFRAIDLHPAIAIKE